MIEPNIYTPIDIKWVKNVSNKEGGSAYMDKIQGEFTLNFPNKHKENVLKPKAKDLILIFQKINGQNLFTHLVTPINSDRIEENNGNYNYGREVQIIAHASLEHPILISSTIWGKVNFQGISQGNACEIVNIKSIKEPDLFKAESWNFFKSFFLPNFIDSIAITEALSDEIAIDLPTLTVMEGKQRLITHIVRERNRDIINQKKINASENGCLFCEVCGFSFLTIYGVEFIECHHIEPISNGGERVTRLEDLALVCPNCHKILHRKINGEYLTLEKLKLRIEERTHNNVYTK